MNAKHKNGYNRNYWAMATEGSCFMGGTNILSTSGAVALFISAMTGSMALVGLAVTIPTLASLIGQLATAPYLRSIRKLPEFIMKTMLFQRLVPLYMAVPLFFGAAGGWSVGIFLVLLGVFWFCDGFMSVPWGELCVRAINPELRGHMMGMQVTLGGIVSLLTGLLLTWLLATPILSENYRYAMVFVLAAVILLPSLIFMGLVRDPSPIGQPEKLHMREYYRGIPSVIRNSRPLRLAVIARMPAYVGFSAVTFMVVFGSSALHLTEAQISWLVYANIIGGLAGGFFLGETSRRFGNKKTILLCNLFVILTISMAVSLVFFPGLGYPWLFATCVFSGLTLNSWIGYFNYFLDIAPDKERSAFQVIGASIGIPFSFVGYAMGAVIDRWGFLTAFMIGGVFSVTGFLLSFRLLSRRQIYELQDEMEAAAQACAQPDLEILNGVDR